MKLWGGRFARHERDPLFEKFSESFSVDCRLVEYDFAANAAFVRERLAGANAPDQCRVRLPATMSNFLKEDLPGQLRAAGIERCGAAVNVVITVATE